MHEEGKGHQEKYIAKQKALREAKAAQAKSEKTEASQWASLDEAATAAYERDLIAQGNIPPPRAGTAAGAAAAAAAPAHAGASKPKHSHSAHSYPPPPSAAPYSSSSAAASAASPSLWQPTLDPSTGATYYFHIQTHATSWTNPDEDAHVAKMAAEEAEAEAGDKRERKKADKKDGAVSGGGGDGGAESKEEAEPKSKKQRIDSSSTPTTATIAAAASVPPAAAAAVEIDEDTGFGRWESVAVAPEPSEAERAAAAAVPRMTPFGMTTPDAPAAGAGSGAAVSAKKPEVAAHWANSNHAADDSADADEDDAAPVDMAQQLRKQFGNSKLISSRATIYQPGQNLLQDDEADAAAAEAAATATISFKKKRDRSANLKKPVAATNK